MERLSSIAQRFPSRLKICRSIHMICVCTFWLCTTLSVSIHAQQTSIFTALENPAAKQSMWQKGANNHAPQPLPHWVKRIIPVNNVQELERSIRHARPGDYLRLSPGEYRLPEKLRLLQPGTREAPIGIGSKQIGDTILTFDLEVGMDLKAPFYLIENLYFKGTCKTDESCQHAIHVTSRARQSTIRNNIFHNFDAAVKINGANGFYPDNGKILQNTLFNDRARKSSHSVTPIDLVAASGWQISDNFIHQFSKQDGNKVSYGVFVKGGGANTELSRNLIICDPTMDTSRHSIGLSVGGGGTGFQYRRNHTAVEYQGASIHHNIILYCSDVGIYLNQASESAIHHNLLYQTQGIDVRFEHSSAQIDFNILDGDIRSRERGKILSQQYNLIFAHPGHWFRESLDSYFQNPTKGQFSLKKPFKFSGIEIISDNSQLDFCEQKNTLEKEYIGPIIDARFACLATPLSLRQQSKTEKITK